MYARIEDAEAEYVFTPDINWVYVAYLQAKQWPKPVRSEEAQQTRSTASSTDTGVHKRML